MKYNTAGAGVSQTDPRGRVSKVFYADNWSDTTRTTYAYPTTITDPSGNYSTIQYRFDTGASVWAQSPTPAGASNGKTTSRTYDDTIGRLIKEEVENTGAYTRYVYANTGNSIATYATLVDIVGVGTIDSSDEVLTETLLDGAGRLRKTRTENPNSTGGYSGKLVEYDILGRVKRETVPTEINSSWNPAGDDDRGTDGSSNPIWLWNSREYDWKGRVTREINTDGTDKLYSYAGCGCAGGQVTTVKGEITDAFGVNDQMQSNKRRTQKIYEDILGRTFKSEIWDLDGAGSSPYSTVKTTFNGRDQAILIRQHAGSDSSTTYQDTTLAYDGHGRALTKHLPEYDASTTTAWTYNTDDTVATVTDPRGASVAYKYGNADDSSSSEYRALLTKILYTSPNTSTIPDPTDVSFAYDPAGNRTYMSDESGDLTYAYDELSRLTSETKNFADTLSSAPSGGYVLSYNYELTGGLKSMTGPFGHEINYTSDAIGRITAVGDASSPTAYASAVAHRSFGAIKSASLSATDPIAISLTYDSALRSATYEADSTANSGEIHKASYAYHNDGMLSTLDNQADAKFDQLNKFDFAGRLKVNDVGTSGVAFPFKQILSYDAFNNLIARTNWTYGLDPVSFSATYANNRKTSGGSADYYDAAGNVTSSNQAAPTDNFVWKFDAAGRQRRWEEFGPYGNTTWKGGETTFDGDGRPVTIANLTKTFIGGVWGSWNSVADHCIYSSVTGKKVTSLDSDGAHYRTHVYLGSARIADERNGEIWFNLTDPLSGSTRETDEKGDLPSGDEDETRNELGGLGTSVPLTEPSAMPPPRYPKGSWPGNSERCSLNGSPHDCGWVSRIAGSDPSAVVEVNIRAEGGWALYNSLRNQVRTWEYKIYKLEPGNAPLDSPEVPDDDETEYVPDDTTWVATIYVSVLSTTGMSRISRSNHGFSRGGIRDIVAGAREVLAKTEKGSPCDKLFKKGAKKALEKLNGLEKGGDIKLEDTDITVPDWQTGFPTDVMLSTEPMREAVHKKGKIYFNPNGNILKGRTSDRTRASYGGMTDAALLTMILIHELLHVTKDFGSDSDNTAKSVEHTRRVYESCFKK